MSPFLERFSFEKKNDKSSADTPANMSSKDNEKAAMDAAPKPVSKKYKYVLYPPPTEPRGREHPKETVEKVLAARADARSKHQTPAAAGPQATSISKNTDTKASFFNKITRTQPSESATTQPDPASKVSDCHLRGGGGDTPMSRTSSTTNTTMHVSSGPTVSSRSSIQYKPFNIWKAHPEVVAVPKNEEDREHGKWCKLKKKFKAKMNIETQPLASLLPLHNHKHKFREGHCKRCGLAESGYIRGPPLTSGAFCVQRCCASGEETSRASHEMSRVSDAAPRIAPIRISNDQFISPDTTKFTNEHSNLFDATSPSAADTDATSISFESDDLEVGGSPLYYARGGTALSAISEAPADDVSSVEESNVFNRCVFEDSLPASDATLINDTPTTSTVRRRQAISNLQDAAGGQASSPTYVSGSLLTQKPSEADNIAEAFVDSSIPTLAETEVASEHNIFLDAFPVLPSNVVRDITAHIPHIPLVSSFGDLCPTPLTKAMQGRVWGPTIEDSEPSLSEKNGFLPKPDMSKDATYEFGDVLSKKISYNILEDLVHAASYGNIDCQEVLIEVYGNCTRRPRIYSVKTRRLLRKGYLVLELFGLVDAGVISWEIVNIIRKQLFPSLVDSTRYEDEQFTAYIHHSVSNGALPKMSANQTLVLAANDDSGEESAAEKAVFEDRELFGLKGVISVDQTGSIDRQVHVATYDKFFAPEWVTWEKQHPNPQNTPVKPKLKKKASMHSRKDSYSPERSLKAELTEAANIFMGRQNRYSKPIAPPSSKTADEIRDTRVSTPTRFLGIRNGSPPPVDDPFENAADDVFDRVDTLLRRHAEAIV